MKQYVGQKCWQATSQVSIRVGTVTAQEMRGDWLYLLIQWRDTSSVSWEKVTSVSFDLECVC